MVSSSSTKRAARLAQKGKGKRVRFQGGTLFPLVVLGILVAGLALIVYARVSRPAADASPPTIDDHWHIAYGFDLCDQEGMQQLTGNKEDADASGQLLSREYLRFGVHSHDDGVIHWHPSTAAAVGSRAKLGVFLDVYGVELTDDKLQFPPDQLDGKTYEEGETKCGDEDGKLVAVVWDNFSDTGQGTVYTSDFTDIRIDQNSMVIVIGFIPESEEPRDIPMPPWAPNLPELGQADQAPANIGPDGSTPISSTGPTATTAAGSTPGSTAGSTATSTASRATASSAPATAGDLTATTVPG